LVKTLFKSMGYDKYFISPWLNLMALPKEWANDAPRRDKSGVPKDLGFATKPEIALAQIRQALAQGVPMGVVLADAAYGDETAFRDGITAMGLPYAVGIRPGTTVWAPGTAPLPPKAWSGRGIRPTKLRRDTGNEPVSVKALAMALAPQAWSRVSWREGSNSELSGRFAALRIGTISPPRCELRSGC
jgi:SRSO17 transposase